MGQYIWKCCNRIYYLFLHQWNPAPRTSVIYWISEKASQRFQHLTASNVMQLRDSLSKNKDGTMVQPFQLMRNGFRKLLAAWIKMNYVNEPKSFSSKKSSDPVIRKVVPAFAVAAPVAKNGETFVDNFEPTRACQFVIKILAYCKPY